MKNERGFTLVELMIVVSIIALLSAIAIPRFANTIRRANEGTSRGNLGSIRSALGIYYADMEGQYPSDLSALAVNGKYLAEVPKARLPNYHGDATSIVNTATADDNGGWAYRDSPTDPQAGTVFLNCTHTDSIGAVWTSY